jgi:hypothetical protein
MTDLTVEEHMSYGAARAREQEAELFFYKQNIGSHRYSYFSFAQRDTHHWDVSAKEVKGKASAWLAANPGGQTSAQDGATERAFRIRGEPGKIVIFDERWDPTRPHPRETPTFRTVALAKLWIIEELTSKATGEA